MAGWLINSVEKIHKHYEEVVFIIISKPGVNIRGVIQLIYTVNLSIRAHHQPVLTVKEKKYPLWVILTSLTYLLYINLS